MKGDMKGDVNVVRFFRGSCDGWRKRAFSAEMSSLIKQWIRPFRMYATSELRFWITLNNIILEND